MLIPFNDVHHLSVVLNDPCPDGLCLIVMVTSIKPGRAYDKACLLDVGDHEFIVHPSFVLYRMAETVKAVHISNMVDKNYYVAKADASKDLLAKVVAGLEASNETKPRVLKYARSNGVVTGAPQRR